MLDCYNKYSNKYLNNSLFITKLNCYEKTKNINVEKLNQIF